MSPTIGPTNVFEIQGQQTFLYVLYIFGASEELNDFPISVFAYVFSNFLTLRDQSNKTPNLSEQLRRSCHPGRTRRILPLHGRLKVKDVKRARKIHNGKLECIMKQLKVQIVFFYQIYQFWKLSDTDGIGKDAGDLMYRSGTTLRCHE